MVRRTRTDGRGRGGGTPTGGPADHIRTYDRIANTLTDHRLDLSLHGALDPANLQMLYRER
ncbi:hypothetical protein [Nocardia sp. NPDC004722]